MRRIIIIIMLTTILYSTITTYWSVPVKSNFMLLDTVYGDVAAGNFSYWTFGQLGPLLIELTTLKGDADLFVSEDLKPSFEAEKNNFSSESYGVEVIHIPEEFPRPLGIGIFGHWAYSRSEFMMKVFLNIDINRSLQKIMSNRPMQTKSTEESQKIKDTKKDDSSKLAETEPRRWERPKEEEKPRFLKLFRVLDTVFDLFIL